VIAEGMQKVRPGGLVKAVSFDNGRKPETKAATTAQATTASN
jgi:hypothetical protein